MKENRKDEMINNRKLSIFLCHSSNDKKMVRNLYKLLTNDGFDPWLDKEKILPGQEWDSEIRKAVSRADAIVVCLSQTTITKEGYVQKEIRIALDLADEKPEDAIFLIPARLEECQVPSRLSRWQWVDIFDQNGYQKLLDALNRRAKALGIQRKRIVKSPESYKAHTLEISPGEFIMGPGSQVVIKPIMDDVRTKLPSVARIVSVQPQHVVRLDMYYIGKYPVSNHEYREFVRSVEYNPPSGWVEDRYPDGKAKHPIVNVSWEDALAYCNWLCMKTQQRYRLPTEAEWEKASRGIDGRLYPWGNIFDEKLTNTFESGSRSTSAVGNFSPQGDSPYGCSDMVGNVWEWCADFFDEDVYKARANDKVENPKSPTKNFRDERVLRGGSFSDDAQVACCTYRHHAAPHHTEVNIGFRVARDFTLADFF